MASRLMEHKAIAFSFWSLFESGETDLVLCRLLSSFEAEWGLASNWEHSWKSSGEEKEEKVKDRGDGVCGGVV